MKRKENQKKKQKNQNIQFEEMEKVEEFSTADFIKGVGVGLAIGAVVVLT